MKESLQETVALFTPPILFVSSSVGMGNYSVGEAFKQRCNNDAECYHIAIEDFLPPEAIQEDLYRYKWFLKHFKFYLWLVYTIPIFYYLKYIREKWWIKSDLSCLDEKIKELKIKTVVCISHRPSFWMSFLKTRNYLNFSLYGVLTEFGTNLGWKYICWESMNGFFSIMPKEQLKLHFPPGLEFKYLELPCRREFIIRSSVKVDKNNVLLVAGFWGELSLGKAVSLIKTLLTQLHSLNFYVVCGLNKDLETGLKQHFNDDDRVKIYGKVDSLCDLMDKCASVVTKPGFSTLVEAYRTSKKIFLLRGLPVTEDNNANYAIRYFLAEWYGVEIFTKWYYST